MQQNFVLQRYLQAINSDIRFKLQSTDLGPVHDRTSLAGFLISFLFLIQKWSAANLNWKQTSKVITNLTEVTRASVFLQKRKQNSILLIFSFLRQHRWGKLIKVRHNTILNSYRHKNIALLLFFTNPNPKRLFPCTINSEDIGFASSLDSTARWN